ncbi:hypothetical protein [Pseudomonas syringae]|uniref:hypothetical protein n=1 Tax=Pseudomonas syringae TaxID=317 RepID=UPI001372E1D0|nr:hypothetical protein [Pseudomonas syringae]NAP32620.1 hypothetical protein [Pseudomonas syringae]
MIKSRLTQLLRFTVAFAGLALGWLIVIEAILGMFRYFFLDGEHPLTTVSHILGLGSPFKSIAELSWFDGGIFLVINIMAMMYCYAGLAFISATLSREFFLRVTKGRYDYRAYREQQRIDSMPKTMDLGKLKNVTVNAGGFLSTTTTTLETETGFYVVYGRPGTIPSGSTVRLVGNTIVIDGGNGDTQSFEKAART